MVNVGTGNLLVKTTDVDLRERGMDLAFTRFYNSQSLHDSGGDDGSEPSIFGNLWTNSFDAHIVFRYTGQVVTAISVYDVDGTRCDYTPDINGDGGWTPCIGQYATLEVDPDNSCMYWWIKKDGSSLLFHTDAEGGGCSPPNANLGRLYAIYGRNSNNAITFNYSFSGGHSSQNITQVVVNHSDGQSLTMNFAQFGGINELSTITYPKPNYPGQTVEIRYNYDLDGDLLEVDKPGNDATPDLSAFNVPAGDLPQTYGYTQPLQFLYACGPRATISLWQNQPGPATDGACIHFDFDNSVRLTDWEVNGILNPAIGDGGSQGYLQPNEPTGWDQWYIGYFVYGSGGNNPPCSGTGSGTTTTCDSDGHSGIWTIDTSYKVTQSQQATGKSNPSSLFTTQTWDAKYNLIASTDPRGDITNYAYDNSGNLTALATPSVTDVSNKSSFQGLTLFSYDANNNLISSCDPWFTSNLGITWSTSLNGSDSLCPQTVGSQSSQGATVYQYDTSDLLAEPYGRLVKTYTPMGYQVTLTYDQTVQGGDFGLPTKFSGTQIKQNDQTKVTVQQKVTYDGYGNILTNGNTIGQWTIAYNNLNWPTSTTDPTGVQSFTCYNEDASVSNTTTGKQHQMDGAACGQNSVAYQHDTDGNVTAETHHYNSTTAQHESEITYRAYDGLDRLVSVRLPTDGNIDGGNYGWTRYLYDLSQAGANANLSIGSTSEVVAYGNLYKTQRCISSSCTWQSAPTVDVNGNGYDALDRPTGRYQYTPTTPGSQSSPGTTPGQLSIWIDAYDQGGQLGLLTTLTDPIGTQTTLSYDNADRLQSKSFSDATATVNGTYDLDGRIAKLSSPSVGSENYTYDYDGRLITYSETGNISDPETLSYTYYPNGWRSALNVSDTSASFSEAFSYDYRADGTRTTLSLGSQSFIWTYDNAGRMLSETDPDNTDEISLQNDSFYPAGITIQPRGMQYSSNTGLLSTLTMHTGAQYTNITHDAEGEITGFGLSFPAFSASPNPYVSGVQYAYDSRGEFNQTQATAPSQGGTYDLVQQLQYTNGHPICTAPTQNCTAAGTGTNVTAFTGAVSSIASPSQADSSGCYETQAISYDPNGRQYTSFVNRSGATCQTTGQSLADTRSYDAQNHLISDACTYAFQGSYLNICTTSGGATANYVWGPSGHLSSMGASVLHWDGDNLLFVTNSSHNVIQANIEHLGWLNGPSGTLVIMDRDFSGTVADRHSSTADQGLNVVQSYFSLGKMGQQYGIPTINGQYPPMNALPLGPAFDLTRSDGYQVGTSNVNIQGVRMYDGNTQQWGTPDEYKGTAEDPMSQMAYQWNDNNPLTNMDFSGTDIFSTVHDIECYLEPGALGCDSLPQIANGQVCVTASGGPCSSDQQPEPTPAEANETLSETDAGPGMWALASTGMFGRFSASALSGALLKRQLATEEASAVFTKSGKLTDEAIAAARRIIEPSDLDNTKIPAGFAKYATPTYNSPSGPFQVHFYMNESGTVFYGLDYKAVFVGIGKP